MQMPFCLLDENNGRKCFLLLLMSRAKNHRFLQLFSTFVLLESGVAVSP